MAVYDPSGSGDVHIDEVLTQISVGYPNEAFISERVAPAVRVQKQSDKYYVHGKEGWVLEPGSDVRAPGAVANEIPGLDVSTDTYYCVEHALQIAVTDEERQNADSPLSPDRDGTELVTDKVLLQRELIVRDLVQTAANYPAGSTVTLSGVTQWSDYASATSTPIADVKTGIRAIHAQLFLEPTLGVFPYRVMSFMEDHPDFIERIKYSQPGVLTSAIIGSVIGMQNIVVPGAGTNTAAMGQAESLAYIWGDDVLLAYVPARPGLKIPAYMYEFVWRYPNGQAQVVERWREPARKSDLVRVSRRYDHKFIAIDGTGDTLAGYLIKDAVA